jgi:hypothetical protein
VRSDGAGAGAERRGASACGAGAAAGAGTVGGAGVALRSNGCGPCTGGWAVAPADGTLILGEPARELSRAALRDAFRGALRKSLSANTPSPRGEVRIARDWKLLPDRENVPNPESAAEGDAGGGEPQGTRPATAAGPSVAVNGCPPPPARGLLGLFGRFAWPLW